MNELISKSIVAKIKARMTKAAPEFVPTNYEKELEWHSNAYPLYVKKVNESRWLCVSFAPMSNADVVRAMVAWSNRTHIPDDPQYLEYGKWPEEGKVHFRDGLLTGFTNTSIDWLHPDPQSLMGYHLTVPPLVEREAAVDIFLKKGRAKHVLRPHYDRDIKKSKFLGSFEEYLSAERDCWVEATNAWSFVASVKTLADDTVESVAEEVVNLCMNGFEDHALPFLAYIEKSWPGPYEQYVPQLK